MKIFIDTANLDEIKRAAALGVIDGVTTNPSLVAKEGVEYQSRVMDICEVVDGSISAECISLELEQLCAEARRVAAWHQHVDLPAGRLVLLFLQVRCQAVCLQPGD